MTEEQIWEYDEGHIVKKKDGYHVVSKDRSKHLGGPYRTRERALKRLRQIEYFKHQG